MTPASENSRARQIGSRQQSALALFNQSSFALTVYASLAMWICYQLI